MHTHSVMVFREAEAEAWDAQYVLCEASWWSTR